MFDVIGSFAILFLGMWCLLGILFSVFYRKVKPFIFSSHMGNAIYIYLLWWSAPLLISLFVTALVFIPGLRELFVSSHCHGDCTHTTAIHHAPIVGHAFSELIGISLLILVCSLYVYKLIRYLLSTLNLKQMLEQVAHTQGEYLTVETSTPMVFTFGWFKPGVCISRGLLEQVSMRDLQVVLLHEKMHQQRRDNLILLLGYILTLLLPPAKARDLRGQLRLLTDIACDELTAKKYDRVSVAEALVNVHKIVNTTANSALETRVQKLLDDSSFSSADGFSLHYIVLFTAVCLLLVAEPVHYFYEWLVH